MLERQLLEDVEDIIISSWTESGSGSEYVMIDTVQTRLVDMNYDLTKEDVADVMKKVAWRKGWNVAEAYNNTVGVYPG